MTIIMFKFFICTHSFVSGTEKLLGPGRHSDVCLFAMISGLTNHHRDVHSPLKQQCVFCSKKFVRGELFNIQ